MSIYDTKGADRKKAVAKGQQDLVAQAEERLRSQGLPIPPFPLNALTDTSSGEVNTEAVDWLLNQTPEVQQGFENQGLVSDKVKRTAFLNYGVPLPGVGENGEGLVGQDGKPIDKKRLAAAAAAAESKRGHDLEADIADQNPEDTTLNPTLDQGPGYRLEDRYQYLGESDPLVLAAQEQAINQARSDETGVQGQRDALEGYRDIYSQGGLTAIDRAAMAQAQGVARMKARAAEEGVMRDAAEQGRGGSMLEFLGRQQAQQAATGQIAQQDMNTAAMALSRRDAALGGMSLIGDRIQTAQDAIDEFNTEGERTRIRENLARANAGTETTWSENQNREHANQVFHNQGVGATFGGDSMRSSANADRTNQAATFNATQGGARGILKDRLAARSVAGSHGLQAAGTNYQYGADLDAQQAARDAAQASFLGDLLGTGGAAIGAIYGGPAGAAVGGKAGGTTGKALASA